MFHQSNPSFVYSSNRLQMIFLMLSFSIYHSIVFLPNCNLTYRSDILIKRGGSSSFVGCVNHKMLFLKKQAFQEKKFPDNYVHAHFISRSSRQTRIFFTGTFVSGNLISGTHNRFWNMLEKGTILPLKNI